MAQAQRVGEEFPADGHAVEILRGQRFEGAESQRGWWRHVVGEELGLENQKSNPNGDGVPRADARDLLLRE